MNDIDYAWLSGLIDGEGSFYFRRQKVSSQRGWGWTAGLKITNCNTPILKKVQELMNGKGRIGSYTYKTKLGCEKVAHVYCFWNEDLPELIPHLLPWLVVKKGQAEILLRVLECLSGKKTTEYFKNRFKITKNPDYEMTMDRLEHLYIDFEIQTVKMYQ